MNGILLQWSVVFCFQNDLLRDEVQSLKDDKESLTLQNTRLSEEVWRLSVVSESSGPAESCPLPQGVHSLTAFPRLLLTLFLLALMTGTGSTQKPLPLLSKNSNSWPIHLLQRLMNLK